MQILDTYYAMMNFDIEYFHMLKFQALLLTTIDYYSGTFAIHYNNCWYNRLF